MGKGVQVVVFPGPPSQSHARSGRLARRRPTAASPSMLLPVAPFPFPPGQQRPRRQPEVPLAGRLLGPRRQPMRPPRPHSLQHQAVDLGRVIVANEGTNVRRWVMFNALVGSWGRGHAHLFPKAQTTHLSYPPQPWLSAMLPSCRSCSSPHPAQRSTERALVGPPTRDYAPNNPSRTLTASQSPPDPPSRPPRQT